jgi:hypothetical protein
VSSARRRGSARPPCRRSQRRVHAPRLHRRSSSPRPRTQRRRSSSALLTAARRLGTYTSASAMPPSTAQRMQALRLGTLLDRASMTVPARESICQQWHYARHDTWWKASPCTASAYAKAMDSLCTHAIRKSKKTLPRYEFLSITKGNKFKL